ncbi:MAG: cell division ATP-binding protein FtsE [Rickettsiales bacterium]|nr:cell division ATP-binding protein FtsE [Rickettsiales bacterium]
MIRCHNIYKEYVRGKPIIDRLSLHLKPQSFTFLVGASGAGKSTLLSLFSLAQRPNQGTIRLFGHDVTRLERDQLPAIRRQIGTVFQDYQLLNHLTVAENVALPLKVMGESRKDVDAKVDELLSWIGLERYREAKPPHLSGGQRQRVSVARAVINNPALILADEPTGNLDSAMSMRLMHLFTSLNDIGTTILFATHDEHLISHFDYPVLELKDGKIYQRDEKMSA